MYCRIQNALIVVMFSCLMFPNVCLFAQSNHQDGEEYMNFLARVHLLENESVTRRLEIVGDQKENLRTFLNHTGEESRRIVGQLTPETINSYGSRVELARRYQAELEEILLPFQLEKLKQHEMRVKIGTAVSPVAGLLHDILVERLQLDKKQRESIESINDDALKRLKEVRDESAIAIKELQAQALHDILEKLDLDQQKQLKKLVGSQVDWEATDK